MLKTIKQVQETDHFHEAVGQLFKITFTDGSAEMLYEETFYHQLYEDYLQKPAAETLIGKTLNTEEGWFNYTPPHIMVR